MTQTIKVAAIIAVQTLLILAGVAVLTLLFAPGWHNTLDMRGDAFWKLFILHQLSGIKPEFPAFREHDAHPTLGWVNKPDFRGGGKNNDSETTNNRGHRASEDYVPKPDKYTVVVLGDSFTYGQFAEDKEVWPAILQGLDARLHVINLAVGGYGIDQMYIVLRDTIAEYQPRLVVFALISDDLNRPLLRYREYRKPRFVIGGDGRLLLTNTPIGDIKDTLALLRAQHGRLFARIGLEYENRAFMKRVEDGEYDVEWKALNETIVMEAFNCTREHGSEFLLVHLGSGPEIVARTPGDYFPMFGETFCEALVEKSGIPYLPTRKAFLEAGADWTDGHYRGLEARFVAQLVCDRIRQMPSWARYCKQ